MLSFRIIVVAICAFLVSFCSQNAFAGDSGVIKLSLPDAAAVGMGGAFVGEADRPSAVFYNPAGIVQMDTAEISAGLTTLSPQLNYKSPSGQDVSMRRDTFIFPHVYVTTPIKGNFYFGVGENSNFGAGNDWAPDSLASFTRYTMIHDEFDNQDFMLVGAYKINDHFSIGAGAIDDNSRKEKEFKLLQATGDGDAQNKSRDNAWGWDLAGMFKINDQNQVGLTYKSPIQHTYRGKLYLNNLDPAGLGFLFGGNSFETRTFEKVTLPQSVDLGYSFKPTKKWKFNFDLEWTDWSSVKQSLISFPDLSGPLQLAQQGVLAINNPQSRNWHSVWSEAIGGEYSVNDNLRLRLGFIHHQSPIDNSNFDTTFADLNSNAVTTGIGFNLTHNITLDIAYVAVFAETRKVNTTQGSVFTGDSGLIGNPTLNGTYTEFINIGSATLTYKF
jgi:long-chain fatty acid transport protein